MSANESFSRQIAADLLRIGAVSLSPKEPFTWSSGLKSPIYCDNRLTISYPEVRDRIAEGFAVMIRENYPDAEVIAGAATGGIPHAAWVADKLQLPMVYVRSKPKGHGKGKMIEGVLKEGQKVVVIEDLISTGGSSLNVALAVNESGGHTEAVHAIFSYQLEAAEHAFAKAGIALSTLSNFSSLIEVAAENGSIDQADLQLLHKWRANPAGFGQ